jgi:LacI family transcriptional regulator
MPPPKRVTLKEIARQAGVATGTVSMVLNNNPVVASATRERVQRVIRELGYVYDRGAAQLRNKRTNIVGISICDLLNPYFAEIAAHIEETVGESGRVLVLGNCAESLPRQSRFIHTLREYNVEGLLLMPAVGTPKSDITRVLEWGVPLVQVSRYIPGVATDYAGTDNRRGSALAARHLLALGHRRIGFVGLNSRTTTGRDRFAGFRAALVDAGHAPDPAWVVECAPTRDAGYRGIHTLFESRSSPTAVVCFNDLVAFGVMLGLRHLGVEPGRECSVVGADDVTEAALWQPPLTTVAVDVDGIGRAAGRLLRDRIEQPERPVRRIVLEPRLIVRASCGRPPQSATPTPIRTRAA